MLKILAPRTRITSIGTDKKMPHNSATDQVRYRAKLGFSTGLECVPHPVREPNLLALRWPQALPLRGNCLSHLSLHPRDVLCQKY